MANLAALLALPGASLAGVGMWLDGRIYLQEQVRQAFARTAKRGMDSGFRTLSPDGLPVRMADGSAFAVDGAIGGDHGYDFIWIPSFLAETDEQFELGLGTGRLLIPWLCDQHAQGAILGASGAAILLLVEAGITQDMLVPLSLTLQFRARKMFPRLRLMERLGLADRGDVILSPGASHDAVVIMRAMGRAFSSKAGEFLAWLYGIGEDDRHDGVNPQMERARLLLEQTFASNVAIQMVADRLSISPSALARQFRKAFGVSPKAYVQEVRLYAAKSMLEHTSRKIDDIAANVGYSDSRLFRMMFRKATGRSARQWRIDFQARE